MQNHACITWYHSNSLIPRNHVSWPPLSAQHQLLSLCPQSLIWLMSYCWWEEQRWKSKQETTMDTCTKPRTVGRKDLQPEFHTQAYLSSTGKVMKWRRLMEQQCFLSSVEEVTEQKGWWDRKHGRRCEDENTRRWHYVVTPSDIVGLMAYWTDHKCCNYNMRKMKTKKWRNELVQEFSRLPERLEVILQLRISSELAPDRRYRRRGTYSICCPRD